ncbi:uncharacterized protein LOC112452613 isoform X2 [Temnothorax curvispinosus]|uniref:Uncharacterized protein LOC112452613 isoform X2 n=1 Tax=Temnothorax curvispinosus TaxID=300111 RepID=A0A6J1PH20_9HYME|nr:uncharacterized protein LOC112452613 isoform X2 [Temnothorax curvispinosus]
MAASKDKDPSLKDKNELTTAWCDEKLNIVRSSTQCENRYKTILKRKMQSVRSNQQSGAKRTRVDFEEELNKIKAIDDSLEPEVMQGPGKIIEKQQENIAMDPKVTKSQKAPKKMSISETLLRIQKDKEKKRERRHTEKLDILRSFMRIFSNDTIDSNRDSTDNDTIDLHQDSTTDNDTIDLNQDSSSD